jgi:predicted ATPase
LRSGSGIGAGTPRYDEGVRALDSKLFVLSAEIDRGLDDYRTSVPAIRSADSIAFQKPVTMFIGENGSGKSTLIEAIAIAAGFNPEGRIEELPV